MTTTDAGTASPAGTSAPLSGAQASTDRTTPEGTIVMDRHTVGTVTDLYAYSDDFFDENEDITNRDPRTLYRRPGRLSVAEPLHAHSHRRTPSRRGARRLAPVA